MTKIYVGYINFSCDDFSMIFYFCLVNRKMSPKSLLYYSQLNIYYLLYNISELVERHGFWYCFCIKTSGCENKNGQKKWCLHCILQWDEKFYVDELEKIKKCPIELVLFAGYIFEDLKKKSEFEKSVIDLWDADVSYDRRDYGEGTKWEIYLIDVIEFQLNQNDNCHFV